MAGRPSPTVRRRRLGGELRRLREAAQLTIEQVAEQLEVSDSKISRIETGKVSTTPRDVRDLLAIYGVDDQRRDALMRIAREGKQKSWWHAYGETVDSIGTLIGLEAEATDIWQFEGHLVPGLLQTRLYARALLRTLRPELPGDAVEGRVRLRMERQALLTQAEAPAIWSILDEAVLRRPVGGPEVMRGQLERLAELTELPSLTLQVLPFAIGAHAGMNGAFTILRFAEAEDPNVVYVEGQTNDGYLEGREELITFEEVFKRLGSAALSPEESKDFISKIAKE